MYVLYVKPHGLIKDINTPALSCGELYEVFTNISGGMYENLVARKVIGQSFFGALLSLHFV